MRQSQRALLNLGFRRSWPEPAWKRPRSVRPLQAPCPCGAEEGEFHSWSCEWELCPFCYGHVNQCGCIYKVLHIDCIEGTWVYKNGPTKEQKLEWAKTLTEKGRVPYINWPHRCSYCGCAWPEFFMVSDKAWKHYIEKDHREDIVCGRCYHHIKDVIDAKISSANATELLATAAFRPLRLPLSTL